MEMEVEKELYLLEGANSRRCIRRNVRVYFIHFSERMRGRHDISLISRYLNRGLVAYMGAA